MKEYNSNNISAIGLIACSYEGALLCYKSICLEAAAVMGPHAHPAISMHNHSLRDYMTCIEQDDWKGVGQLMLDSAWSCITIMNGFWAANLFLPVENLSA